MVKPDVDVLSMMPVTPPSAGPDRGGLPAVEVGVGNGVVDTVVVAESEDADGDKVDAAATPDPTSTAIADVTPAPMIQPFFLDENLRRGCSWSFMMKLLFFSGTSHSMPTDCCETVVDS
jgi:hypothetical protein